MSCARSFRSVPLSISFHVPFHDEIRSKFYDSRYFHSISFTGREPVHQTGTRAWYMGPRKLFSQILLDRLIKFRSGKCPDTINQLGFCKGAQTVDHIFTLNTCIEKYVHHLKGNRLYTCFVDFRKAFDSIPREALLQKLSTYGINGKFFNCISYMYRNSNARIKMANKLSDLINIEAGTEQGHTLSPELFKLYIHDLSLQINAMQNTNCPSLSDIPITHLLWADDLVLMALDKSTLQSMIDK